ncbi:MAG: DNA mismatch repair endonuclease MutL [Hyphomicrobiaceae bacterium]|nr:DNA mismatch repair endonuclease MutL [Hyphomicrobiaceae bacterium]MCC0023005.1 DNA mismatch repair endonuclease MutL [Hyphomicrobiaceae bacterium]
MSIRRLPDDLINRIAAGEVVERPASVVKELMENALDAGATRIAITTAGGGRDLIRIVDNGSGMDEHDLRLSVERHATSKLSHDDLDDIRSLGFRGEALASIGAVSKLSIASRIADAESGLKIEVRNGHIGDINPAGLNRGTMISVENLFENVPARLKFLKGVRAETSAVTDVVKRLAMANPSVHIQLEGSDRQSLNWPAVDGGGALRERLGQVMGADFVANAVDVADTRHGVVVRGLAGLPTFTRANSLHQYFYVNGRSVRDKVLIGAVKAAYADFTFRDRFPVLALFVAVEPEDVDVNVHPAKAEVRFRDPGGVRSAVINAIGKALSEAGYRASSHVADDAASAFRVGGASPTTSGFSGYRAERPSQANLDAEYRYTQPSSQQAGFSGFAEPSAAAAYVPETEPMGDATGSFPLGAARAQIFANYIVAQSDDALILIDQHAAHERLVYERFKEALNDGRVASQAHLIPVVIELPEEDIERLLAAAESLETLGLFIERFGERAIAVRETPALLGRADVQKLIADLVDGLAEWDSIESVSKRLDAIIGRMACHGSVRSGRHLRPDEMNALLRQMEQTPHSGQCIHGRPTYIELKKADLERLFGRD